MSKCQQCHLEIKDDTVVCPLCQCVLETTALEAENYYPNVRIITQKWQRLVRVYVFLAIVLESVLLYLNYTVLEGAHWPLVTGVVLFYGFVLLKFALMNDFAYKTKAIILIIIAIGCIILIDILTGFDGWSLNYFLTGGIILLNSGIVVAMFVNARNWQSYMMIELMTIVWSIVPFILYATGLLTNMIMSQVAFAYSVFLFLGTILIGGKKASTELKRRFHVR